MRSISDPIKLFPVYPSKSSLIVFPPTSDAFLTISDEKLFRLKSARSRIMYFWLKFSSVSYRIQQNCMEKYYKVINQSKKLLPRCNSIALSILFPPQQLNKSNFASFLSSFQSFFRRRRKLFCLPIFIYGDKKVFAFKKLEMFIFPPALDSSTPS